MADRERRKRILRPGMWRGGEDLAVVAWLPNGREQGKQKHDIEGGFLFGNDIDISSGREGKEMDRPIRGKDEARRPKDRERHWWPSRDHEPARFDE